MLSSHSRKGQKLADRQNPVLGQDVIKILKTQDAGYVTTMLQKTERKRARLEQQLILTEDQGAQVLGSLSSQEKGSHKVFVNNEVEQKQYKSNDKPSLLLDSTTRKLRSRSVNEEDWNEEPLVVLSERAPKPCRAVDHQDLALKQDRLLRKLRRREQDARTSKLAALNAREKDLTEAKNELELQRAKMSNCVSGTTKAGAKWKVRERKK